MRRSCASSRPSSLKAFVAEQVPEAISTRRIIAEGKICREILNAAQAFEAAPIAIGSHHPERKDCMLGPDAARVVRHADCSILVMREQRSRYRLSGDL